MAIQTPTRFTSNEPGNDYLEYFFLRLKSLGGAVMTATGQNLATGTMLAHGRGSQLFQFQADPQASGYVQIINQATQLALGVVQNGVLALVPQQPNSMDQLWSITADNQIMTATSQSVVALSSTGFALSGPLNPTAVPQQFEFFYPSDFCYVRNCWTGRFLTADGKGGVSWQLMIPARDDFQQWGIISDGFLVNRGCAEVLQLSGPTPSQQMPLATGVQVDFGNCDTFQRFDANRPDGTFHTMAGNDFVIATGPSGQAVVAVYSESDYTQLTEFISIFQFFSLECGNWINGQQPWLARSGNTATVTMRPSGGPEQLFTVSRYGELINPIDGFVIQSQGSEQVPQFVDPAPDAIGYDSTTFVYNQVASTNPDYGAITLRSGGLGLITYGGRPPAPWMYQLSVPVSGSQSWQLIGAQGSLFASYQQLAEQFFSNPAPLPGGQEVAEPSDPELDELVATLNKAPKVIITLIAGMLDIGAGISVGSVADNVVTAVARIVLGNAEVAAKVAVIMQGTITAASIIAVADGITKAGLWWQILTLLLPNSFWGWTITIAKLSLTVASWAVGVGPAVTGAKIALLVFEITGILASDAAAAARDAEVISAHVVRSLAKPGRQFQVPEAANLKVD